MKNSTVCINNKVIIVGLLLVIVAGLTIILSVVQNIRTSTNSRASATSLDTKQKCVLLSKESIDASNILKGIPIPTPKYPQPLQTYCSNEKYWNSSTTQGVSRNSEEALLSKPKKIQDISSATLVAECNSAFVGKKGSSLCYSVGKQLKMGSLSVVPLVALTNSGEYILGGFSVNAALVDLAASVGEAVIAPVVLSPVLVASLLIMPNTVQNTIEYTTVNETNAAAKIQFNAYVKLLNTIKINYETRINSRTRPKVNNTVHFISLSNGKIEGSKDGSKCPPTDTEESIEVSGSGAKYKAVAQWAKDPSNATLKEKLFNKKNNPSSIYTYELTPDEMQQLQRLANKMGVTSDLTQQGGRFGILFDLTTIYQIISELVLKQKTCQQLYIGNFEANDIQTIVDLFQYIVDVNK